MSVSVVASSDNTYVRTIVLRALERGLRIDHILMGSRAENVLFKVNSLRRIRGRLGWLEVLRRLRSRHADVDVHSSQRSLKEVAESHGIPVVEYDSVNSGAVLAALAQARSGVVVLAGCGLVDRAFIAAASGRCINGHPALLPGLRGVDVVDWALHLGRAVGVTAHLVEPAVDSGAILVSRPVHISPGESYAEFRRRVVAEQAEVVVEAAHQVVAGRAQGVRHAMSESTLCFAAPDRVRRDAIVKYHRLASAMETIAARR